MNSSRESFGLDPDKIVIDRVRRGSGLPATVTLRYTPTDTVVQDDRPPDVSVHGFQRTLLRKLAFKVFGDPPLLAGDAVSINDGQFAGYTGSITRVDAIAKVIFIEVDVFDRPVELQLDYATAKTLLDTSP
ncbi:hypothetical protein [Rhodopirellula sallentina]|uniref:KOW domain-containing protein n=1 Tax=Rhodopirellula sallentina SM41 TaxID=1263870 RepID=M5TVE5_9BACT|nr:hypothetical protein [Rhodopirellula sallentina]EMI53024.1 hypothetical protein RSSM_05538 [Rhodopirellula sallentina SM41]